MSTPSKSVLVIGAGLGGLSAAISLRALGYEVRILEKNERIGGKLNYLEKQGFGFDLGPSIFTLPQIFRDLFKRAGRRMEDYVQLEAVSPHWRNFFEDGTVLDLHYDRKMMQAELAKLPGDADSHWGEFESFLAYARRQYEITEEGYFNQGLDNLWEFIRFYGLKKLIKDIDHKRSMAEAVADHFTDPKLRAIFEYFIKYVGSSAKDAPGYMNLMSIIQFDYDLWYVSGGMYNLARGLGKLLDEMGVEVLLKQDVSEILKDGKRVKGVRTSDGKEHKADIVVSNMEVIPAHEKLLGAPMRTLKKLRKFTPACSGLVVHLGTDIEYPQLAHHNFFYSKDQGNHFDTVFQKGALPEDPTIYLVAPTRTDPSKAPEGCDNIKILPHIPPINPENPLSHEDYMAFRERVLEKLERMGLTDLRKHSIVEDTLTPPDLEEMYRSNRGSIYGVVTDWKKNHGFKAPKKARAFKNLWFTGGSVNPGGGMPMVILCGQKVADRIGREDGLC